MDSFEASRVSLLDRGLNILRDLLGDGWEVALSPEAPGAGDTGGGALVRVTPAGDSTIGQLLVDPRATLTPRVVNEQLAPKAALMRRFGPSVQPLVITEALTARAKGELRKHQIGYVDLCGNVWLRMSHPAVVLMADVTDRRPRGSSASLSRPKLAGPRAGRLVRLLVDVAPPYQAADLAAAAGLSKPYVSKLLAALEDQMLIRRQGRLVTEVDWLGILRARAERLSLLRHNPYVGMIAPNGPGELLDRLRALQAEDERVLLTGSHAARQVAPTAVGGQVMLYVPHTPHGPDEVGRRLGLLRVEHGADTLLLRAHDDVVFARPRTVDGIRQVALSQLALDCLSGPGRMPAEGEAILSYMGARACLDSTHPDTQGSSERWAAEPDSRQRG